MKIMVMSIGLRLRSAVFATIVALATACSTPRPYTGGFDAGIDGSSTAGGPGHAGDSGGTGGTPGSGGVPGTGGNMDAGAQSDHSPQDAQTGSGGFATSSGGTFTNPGGAAGIGSGGVSTGGTGGFGGLGAGPDGFGGRAIGSGGSQNGGSGQVAGPGGKFGSGGINGAGGMTGSGGSQVSTCSPACVAPTGGTSTCVSGNCMSTCNTTGQSICSNKCVDTSTDSLNCGACNAPCGGTCQSGVCCPTGKVNCGGVCVDISSDDNHCGACQGATAKCGSAAQCIGGACRGLDGQPCTANGDCSSGTCRIFYGDQDSDAFPSQTDRKGWCGASTVGADPAYILPRPDGKWDCCDQKGADWIYPGAPASGNWSTVVGSICGISFGDTNCDGQVDVSKEDVSGCNLQPGNTCTAEYAYHPASDCGMTISGCNCAFSSSDNSCYIQCFVSEHLQCQ